MSFVPYKNKIEIEPLKKESPLVRSDFLKAGKVIAIGSEVTTVKVGDILFFREYGCWDTEEYEDVVHHLVTEAPEFILGTYVA